MNLARRLCDDQDGLSTVVGAFVVTAIIIAMVATVRVSYVPIWEAQKEADRMRDVEQRLGLLRSVLDQQLALGMAQPMTVPLPLVGDSSPFLNSNSQSNVEFRPTSRHFTLEAPQVLLDPGTDPGVNETWIDVSPTGLSNVTSVESFRLKVARVASDLSGKWLMVDLTDAARQFAGSFRVEVDDSSGPDFYVRTITRDARSQIIHVGSTAIFQGDSLSPYWVDLLEPSRRFSQVVESAQAPFTIGFTSGGLDADYAIRYGTVTDGGSGVIVGGGDQLVLNHRSDFAGGTLVYHSPNPHFTPQTLSLEHGALILTQPDGSVFRGPPPMTFSRTADVLVVDVNLPELEGFQQSLSGPTSNVRAQLVDRSTMAGATQSLVFTVETSFPRLWAQYWNRTLEEAGWTSLGTFPNFRTEQSPDQARLVLLGLQADPASPAFDIQFRIAQARIVLNLLP